MINNVDRYLGIANKAKREYGLNDDYCAMISMLRKDNDNLYVVVPFVKTNAKVWSKEEIVVPEYWCMINVSNDEVVEFNKTSEKSFINNELINNTSDDSFNKEISKYVVKTKMKYKEYIENDIKNNDLLTYQKDVINLINNSEDNISFNDYFYANLEDNISEEINKLVDLVAATKYNSLTTYYDVLFTNIVKEYKEKNIIDNKKLELACKLMNTYYPGVNGINNIFYN